MSVLRTSHHHVRCLSMSDFGKSAICRHSHVMIVNIVLTRFQISISGVISWLYFWLLVARELSVVVTVCGD